MATFVEQSPDLARTRLMIESLRTFGGRRKDAPVWVYLTDGLLASESEDWREIESLGGELRLGRGTRGGDLVLSLAQGLLLRPG